MSLNGPDTVCVLNKDQGQDHYRRWLITQGTPTLAETEDEVVPHGGLFVNLPIHLAGRQSEPFVTRKRGIARAVETLRRPQRQMGAIHQPLH